ncbi:MAG: NADH-quinone oxidoreductase subunit NuoG [Burkholderiales bacterium]|nr:NADH-quinone oxidoreductase subunit NuoG [Burkholderiales bacterium]
MANVNLEVDGKPVEVPASSTVMEAANRLGIYIPHFCYHKKLSIAANCRMCLVQVEKAPKPLPACATPVTEGMKVFTHSNAAVTAQKGVMEFLLINHPLDCPICDQGGECQLQDLAVGYGASNSRYREPKRVVPPKDIGPLVAAEEMTRCIHCTRCVRFGQEIAGVMELGMAGRGEHSEILSFVGRTVDSELSGNMIDLCPVGALTSKPFRFSARGWELARRKSVSPHDGLGSNLLLQVKQDRVMRVLPLENEAINECWLSDKDRFSYEGLDSPERLARPMVKRDGAWVEVEWPVALEEVARGLTRVRERYGAAAMGALATPHSTLEEMFLLARLMRTLGSGNVDFRLRQRDFSQDGKASGIPWLGMPIAEVGRLDRVLVIGSQLRKDHPLLAARLRVAARKSLQIGMVNCLDDDQLMPLIGRHVVSPAALPGAVAEVVQAVAALKGQTVDGLPLQTVSPQAQDIAQSLVSGTNTAVFLGNLAQHHPQAALLQRLAHALAQLLGARCGFLGEAANSVGGYLAGAVPFEAPVGLDTHAMLAQPRKAYLLWNVEPELDCHDPQQALSALKRAEFVVACSPFRHRAIEYAHVLLPIAPFTETAGAFVNTEGRLQSFVGVVRPYAEARPGWKVLRVLGTLLGLSGFDHDSAEAVRAAALRDVDIGARLSNEPAPYEPHPGGVDFAAAPEGLQRIAEVPIHFADNLARRSPPLQMTHDATPPCARMAPATLARLGLSEGEMVRVTQGLGHALLKAVADRSVPADCVRIAAGHPSTAGLGEMFGEVLLERVASGETMTA